MEMTNEELIEKYIKLRDLKDEKRAAADAEINQIEGVLKQMEHVILTRLNEAGLESMRSKIGTAFKKTVTKARVANWDEVLACIINEENWSMLERRINKTAVEQYLEEHGEPPPGVSWTAEVGVSIRRS